MIQEETNLVVADNSGAKKVRCIRVLGGHDRRYAGLGDLIVVCCQTGNPGCRGKKRRRVQSCSGPDEKRNIKGRTGHLFDLMKMLRCF